MRRRCYWFIAARIIFCSLCVGCRFSFWQERTSSTTLRTPNHYSESPNSSQVFNLLFPPTHSTFTFLLSAAASSAPSSFSEDASCTIRNLESQFSTPFSTPEVAKSLEIIYQSIPRRQSPDAALDLLVHVDTLQSQDATFKRSLRSWKRAPVSVVCVSSLLF